jgi:uncharacterized protein
MARPASPFEAHVTDLLRSRNAERPARVDAHVDWHVELSRVDPDEPVEGDFDLVAGSGGILVRGTISGSAVHTCFRCLTEWEEPFEVRIAELFVTGDAGEDDYEVHGDIIDLEPVMRDAVMLSFPLRPRCGDDCPGLVADGPSDLNTDSSGDEGEQSSPFAVLRDLFGPGD